MNINNFETEIKSILTNISDFAVVYDFHNLNPSGYPYASFELSQFDGNILDSCSDEITLEFGVICYQEISNLGRENAKNKLYEILGKIIKDFRKNADFNGIAKDIGFLRGNFGTYEGKEGEVMFLEIFLQIKTILFLKN